MTGRYDTNLPPINLYQGSTSLKGGLGPSILYENPHAFLKLAFKNTTYYLYPPPPLIYYIIFSPSNFH